MYNIIIYNNYEINITKKNKNKMFELYYINIKFITKEKKFF